MQLLRRHDCSGQPQQKLHGSYGLCEGLPCSTPVKRAQRLGTGSHINCHLKET